MNNSTHWFRLGGRREEQGIKRASDFIKIPGGKGRLLKRTELLVRWKGGNVDYGCGAERRAEGNFFFLLQLNFCVLAFPRLILWVSLDLLKGCHPSNTCGEFSYPCWPPPLSHCKPDMTPRTLVISHCVSLFIILLRRRTPAHSQVSFLPSAIYWWKWKFHVLPPGCFQFANRLWTLKAHLGNTYLLIEEIIPKEKIYIILWFNHSFNKHLLNEKYEVTHTHTAYVISRVESWNQILLGPLRAVWPGQAT